ncbi:hypothetical protein ABW20_dc0108974 [Dactylellina cionopaga]|nr:hypothetical protein ABW20_dc0108974 [Dactylellina cionopaga]
MTLRTKLAAFHARIHSHRHSAHSSSSHHFHLPGHFGHHKSKKEKDGSHQSSPPSRTTSKAKPSKSPSRRSSNRDSLSSSSTLSSSGHALSPVLTLIVPTSSHDLTIEARVYHPPEFPVDYGCSQKSQRKAAVVAHPYASLGGNWDDPVVLSLVALLTSRGWVVATFNFGGAGNSKGKTSWTGAPEREEYATIAAFVIKYVECLDPHSFSLPTSMAHADTTPITASGAAASSTAEKPPIKVLLAGYSYGSLIASRTPCADAIVKSCDRDVLAYATRTAYEWASTEKRRSFAMNRGAAMGRSPWCLDDCDDEEEGGETSKTSDRGVGDEKNEVTAESKVNYQVQMKLDTAWLLVSPLLPPVSILLNLPNPFSWFHKGRKKEHENEAEAEGGTHEEGDEEKEMLVVYGTDDLFTGVGRYRNWVKGRTEKGEGRFKAVEVEDASHFWMQEEVWMVKLREGVTAWLDGRSPTTLV